MTIEEMRERKRILGYSYEQIAKLSGLPLGTVQKVLGGITKAPRYDTLKALEEVLAESSQTSVIHEPEAAYSVQKVKKQGEYTVADYLAWPEDERIELIDGVIYDMSAPTDIHQLIILELSTIFREYIRRHKGQCIPVISPIDVQLGEDDRTIVQPDIAIVCDRNKFKNGRIKGALDLIVEVLSPSTRKKDMVTKLSKYMEAHVREYWIVDIDKKRVIVYADNGKDDIDIGIYAFDDQIPVRIFDNELNVDL